MPQDTLSEESGIQVVLAAAQRRGGRLFHRVCKSFPTLSEFDGYVRHERRIGSLLAWIIVVGYVALAGAVYVTATSLTNGGITSRYASGEPIFRMLYYLFGFLNFVFPTILITFLLHRRLTWERPLSILRKVLKTSDVNALVTSVQSNPAICHLALRGTIERTLRQLPNRKSAEVQNILQQLTLTTLQWREIQNKIERFDGRSVSVSEDQLKVKQNDLKRQVTDEGDGMTLKSLQNQLSSVTGQLEALHNLQAWQTRLRNAQQESTESLRHLRSRLVLQITSGDLQQTISQAYTSLQSLNNDLASAQNAQEEVLQA